MYVNRAGAHRLCTSALSTQSWGVHHATEHATPIATAAFCDCTPCGICASFSLTTHENSTLCVQAQTDNVGCHACGRFECFSMAPDCHAKCTRSKHVCGSSSAMGCNSCGHLCHESNTDMRCPYFQRCRLELAWDATDQQLMDTKPGTGGAVPHMSQVVWRFSVEKAQGGRPRVDVDGVTYSVGHGDPGRAHEGEYNNCLIDSMRQCIGIHVDRRKVRADLVQVFGSAPGRADVTHSSFLDVESHWRSILESIFRHNTSGIPAVCNIGDYCVIALDATNPGNGNVNGNLAAPYRLVVLNSNDVHFDPCLRIQSDKAASSGAR